MVEKMPSEVITSKIKKYEELRASLDSIMQLEASKRRELEESKMVLEELKKLPDDAELFRQVGFVLVPVKKEDIASELEEKIEKLEVDLKKIENVRQKLQEDLERLLNEINALYSGQGGSMLGG